MLERILKWSLRLKPSRVALIAGLAVMTTVLVVTITQYRTSLKAIQVEVTGDLRRIAQVAATMVDGDQHRTFKTPMQEFKPEYERAIAPLGKLQNSSPEIAYVYTLISDRGRVRFVLDPTPSGDRDNDGIDDKSHIYQLYPQVSDAALTALRDQVSTAESYPTTDDWGTFISGYAPVFDSKGKFVAIVGVDLEARDYLARIGGVKQAAALSIVLGTLLSIAIALVVGFAQKVALAQHKALLARQRELAAAKTSLEEAATAEQTAREQMQVASNRFQLLFNELPVACFTFDGEGRIQEWNDLFEKMFGYSPHDLMLRPLSEIFGALAEPLTSAIEGQALHDYEWTFERNGRRLILLTNAFAIELQDEQVGGIGSILDITERKQLELRLADQLVIANDLNGMLETQRRQLEVSNRRLEELSITDGLTGIRNRRSLDEEISRCMHMAERQGTKLSALLIDVDHFKQFNDTFGHLAGDEVLITTAQILKDAVREYDIVSRYGGEEFCILLPSTDLSESLAMSDRLRLAIQNHPWQHRAITISIGASTWDFHSDREAFIGFADLALYRSKANGRNRVSHASMPEDLAA